MDNKPPQCPLRGDECKGYELPGLDAETEGLFMVVSCERQPCPAVDPEAWLREWFKQHCLE